MKSFLSFILFFALAACAFIFFQKLNQPDAPDKNNSGFLKTEQELRNKLAEFRMEQDKVTRRMALLTDRKNETVALLKSKGVTSKSNLDDDKEVSLAVNNLKKDVTDINHLQGIIDQYEKGILSIESMLKEMERDRITAEVAVTEDKQIEIAKIITDLDEKLGVDAEKDILEEERLRDLLDLELGADQE